MLRCVFGPPISVRTHRGAITTSAHRVRDVWATFCRTSTHVNHRVARAALSPESSKLGFWGGSLESLEVKGISGGVYPPRVWSNSRVEEAEFRIKWYFCQGAPADAQFSSDRPHWIRPDSPGQSAGETFGQVSQSRQLPSST